jgi:hypothetical protein
MILHLDSPVTILAVRDGRALIRYPNLQTARVRLHTLRGSWGGDLEVGWEVLRVRQAEQCGRRQRRMAI